LCGGPLDPWMLHCCPECGCAGLCDCLTSLCCSTTGCPAPACPAPVCPAPACPTPYCPTPGYPMMSPIMPMPAAPFTSPSVYGPTPVPTFAEPCPTCGPSPSAGISGYPQTVEGPYPGMTNYPQLFQAPPMAPPPQPEYVDQFQMPTPVTEGEAPPAADQMPPHYEQMESPAGQPMPANRPPMQTSPPMPGQQPMPMPTGTEANQTSYPRMMPPSITQQGVVQPGAMQYYSRRQLWIPVRL
jgi:hypothetical protein